MSGAHDSDFPVLRLDNLFGELAILGRMNMCMYDPAETPLQWRSLYDRQLAQCELARKKQEVDCVIRCPYMRLHELVHGLTNEIRGYVLAFALGDKGDYEDPRMHDVEEQAAFWELVDTEFERLAQCRSVQGRGLHIVSIM